MQDNVDNNIILDNVDDHNNIISVGVHGAPGWQESS